MDKTVRAWVAVPGAQFPLQHWQEIDPATLYREGDDVVQIICGMETARWPRGEGVWMGTALAFPRKEGTEERRWGLE